VVIPAAALDGDDGEMQVLASHRSTRPPLAPVIIGGAVGIVLLTGGLFLAWLALATPVVGTLTPAAIRPSLVQVAAGGAVWAVALVAPPSFAIVGTVRLARVVRAVTARPTPRAVAKLAGTLGDDYVVAQDARLPDGRVLRNLIVGPFGLAVLNELPPPSVTRHNGSGWEIRRRDGRWIPYENPIERTARDGERVKAWFGDQERDFTVKVYSAAVTADTSVARTPACAVISAEQIPAWLASLPPSRSLTLDRRNDVVDMVRSLL
jgi:membrane protein implicated in regulation of membrane protease activity